MQSGRLAKAYMSAVLWLRGPLQMLMRMTEEAMASKSCSPRRYIHVFPGENHGLRCLSLEMLITGVLAIKVSSKVVVWCQSKVL